MFLLNIIWFLFVIGLLLFRSCFKKIYLIFTKFSGYLCFLSIFVFPLSLSLQIKLNYKIFILYFLFFWSIPFQFFELGELNFGFLNYILMIMFS